MAYGYDPDDEEQFFYDNNSIFSPNLLRRGKDFPEKTSVIEKEERLKPAMDIEAYSNWKIGEKEIAEQKEKSYLDQLRDLEGEVEIDEIEDIAPPGEDILPGGKTTDQIAFGAEGPIDIPILESKGPSMDEIAQKTIDTTSIDVPTDTGITKPGWSETGGGMGKVQAVGAAAQLVAGGIGMLDKTEEVDAPNYIAGILGSAGQGASMGAMFSPWGAGIGGVIGAGTGLIKTLSQDKATNAKIQQREEQERRFAQARSTTQVNPMFAEDGMKIPIKPNEVSSIRPTAKLNYSKVGTEAGQLSGSLGFRGRHSKNIGENVNLYSSTYGNLNIGSQGMGVNAGLGAGINWEFMDKWKLNPYMNVNASFMGGQLNSGVRGGARLSYMFEEGGKTPSYINQLDSLML